jgi:hypothetical protein
MYCLDLKQLSDMVGRELPKQLAGEHNALADALDEAGLDEPPVGGVMKIEPRACAPNTGEALSHDR